MRITVPKGGLALAFPLAKKVLQIESRDPLKGVFFFVKIYILPVIAVFYSKCLVEGMTESIGQVFKMKSKAHENNCSLRGPSFSISFSQKGLTN